MQNSRGLGPYRGCIASDWADEYHDTENGHPTPLQEEWKHLVLGTVSDVTPYKFAFKDIDQLLDWFTERELTKLHELGYNIVTMDLDPQQVWEGTKQVCYEEF